MPELIGSFIIPAGHPALPGHFPGRPVVPGVVLLDEALRLLEATGHPAVKGLSAVKFRRPVLPDRTCRVMLARQGRRLSIAIECDGDTAVTALAQLR